MRRPLALSGCLAVVLFLPLPAVAQPVDCPVIDANGDGVIDPQSGCLEAVPVDAGVTREPAADQAPRPEGEPADQQATPPLLGPSTHTIYDAARDAPRYGVTDQELLPRRRHLDLDSKATGLPAKNHFALGARLGIAFPVGKLVASNSLTISHWVPFNVPIQLDFGRRLVSGFFFGGYLQVAPHATANCSGGGCYALSLRLGVQAEFRFGKEEWPLMPWVGAAVGWEWLRAWREAYLFGFEYLLSGPELVLQGGVEFRLGSRWTLGPYLAAHASPYLWEGRTLASSAPVAVDNITIHAWAIVGIRSSVRF